MGVVFLLALLRRTRHGRPASRNEASAHDGTPKALSPRPTESLLRDSPFEASFAEYVREARRAVAVKALGALLATVPLFAVLQGLANPQAFRGDDLRVGELVGRTALASDDAKDVVLALLTVVAAVSIALAVATPKPSRDEEAETYSAVSVWAQTTVLITSTTSSLALAVALTQWWGMARDPVVATVLTGAGLIGVGVAAAVTTYTGQFVFDVQAVRRRLRSISVGLDALPVVRPRRRGRPAWWLFLGHVLVNGFAVAAVANVAVEALPGGVTYTDPWPVWFLRLWSITTLVAAGLLGLTTQYWRSRMVDAGIERHYARLIRDGFVAFLTSLALLAASIRNTPSNWLLYAIVWVGAIAVPLISAYVARTRGRGPAVFLMRIHVDWATRQRRLTHERLAALTAAAHSTARTTASGAADLRGA